MSAAEVMNLTTAQLDDAIVKASVDLKLLKDFRKAKATQEAALAELAKNAEPKGGGKP